VVAAAGAQVEVLDSRRLGGAWVLDRLWRRIGIGDAVRRVPAGRRLDAELVERVLFALVAQRALEPSSKLAATRWVAERVAVEGLAEVSDDQAYRGMDVLLDALGEVAGEVFAAVAHLRTWIWTSSSWIRPRRSGRSIPPTSWPISPIR
jgi:hypothetical protein